MQQCIICLDYLTKEVFVYDANAHVCDSCVEALAKGKKIVIVIEDDSTALNLKRTGTIIYVDSFLIKNEDTVSYIFKSEFEQLTEEIKQYAKYINETHTIQEGEE